MGTSSARTDKEAKIVPLLATELMNMSLLIVYIV